MNSASMSSNAYAFDSSLLRHSSSDMASFDEGGDLFFSDPLPFPFFSPTDVVHQIPDNETYQQHKLDEFSSSLDPFSSSFFSFSPPSTHLENLSLYQQHLSSTATNLGAEFGNVSVKSEDLQMGADYNGNQNFVPPSYNGSENAHKSIQRSYSSNCFDGKPGFLFQPHYDTLIDSSNFQGQTVNSPENDQNMGSTQTNHREGSFLEEANFKVGRYSAEERKEKISKYRAKRGQRNFNKTIKYACRKTLADNRPRIRGRFARNDETGENSRVSCSTRNEEDDEYWFEGLHEEQESMTLRMIGGQYLNSFGDPHFQYHSF
ncbi:zinc finger protein CONSTANS-LIKE 4-like isoform X3 [Neltuma alba]|uniref:zinc finger protein CONSTANS-LIKE 4-like isoform X3 n=1 Tax=Neltuma alba TaxID=207710 RepID=UPI0010A527BA|nr:zinc finger protein CONSTANS-LIKE 4-like isoform X3 [Prosopis alba]